MPSKRPIWMLPALLCLSHAPIPFPLSISSAFAADVPAAVAIDDAPFQQLKSYDFQNRRPVEAINAMIRGATGNAAAWSAIEAKLLMVLEAPESTLGARTEVGRMLRTVGTARSVPALSKLLGDEKGNDIARYALERINDPAAGQALRAALPNAKGAALVGLITSIGNRGDAAAVGVIKPMAASTDRDVAAAATVALGKIGTREALAALQTMPAGQNSLLLDQAILAASSHSGAQPKNSLAIERRLMNDATAPRAIQIGATRAVLYGDAAQAPATVLSLLRGDDAEKKGLAARFVREMPIGSDISALRNALEKLPLPSQALLLGALADRGDKALWPVLLRAAASPDAGLRLSALRSFATMPTNAPQTSDAILLLAKSAARATEGSEKQAAQSTLATMRGAAVDTILLAALPKAEADIRREMISALGQRVNKSARPLLFQMASDADPAIQKSALDALGTLAGEEDYPAVARLLLAVKSDEARASSESLLLRLARQMPAGADRSSILVGGLDAAAPATRLSLIRVLGNIGGVPALNALRAAVKSPDEKLRDVAVRSLASSPDEAAMPDLLAIVKSSPLKVHQILSLRGYLRLADAVAARAGAAPDARPYQAALPLANRAEEKKVIISGLSRLNLTDSLTALTSLLDDSAVRDEAAQAAINIARNIGGAHPVETRAALAKITAIVKDDAILKSANDALKALPAP